MRQFTYWRWHLDEMTVRINGETHYLRGAADHEGEAPECPRRRRSTIFRRLFVWRILGR